MADHLISYTSKGSDHLLSGRPLSLDRDQLNLWLMFRPENLIASLEFFILGGARDTLPESVKITSFNRFNGYSGYEYRISTDCRGEVGFAPLRWGGFAIHKVFADSEGKREIWEIYSSDGRLTSVDTALYIELQLVDMLEMDPRCPILSHLYNYLCHEYEQAQFGQSRSNQINVIETFVRNLKVAPLHRDPAVQAMWKKAEDCEADAVLSWVERQKVLDCVFSDRDKIVRTKLRAHRKNGLLPSLMIRAGDYKNRLRRLLMRPASNIQGFTYKYTIGVMIWFFNTVRGNIGYSMALAIYGPFTFYFITQPLNPHAMWAVGRVRTAYLQTSEIATHVLDSIAGAPAAIIPAVKTVMDLPKPPSPANATTLPQEDSKNHLGLPLSTDIKSVDEQSWPDRMSNFKNMQIGYEENMAFASRMGRLEQMELQLNFSMIVDSTWEETERYLDQLAELRGSLKQPSPALLKYLDDESIRTRRLEMYVWDRLLRYILDHPYVVMDQSKEQVYRDYYMGRSILLLRDMTNKLTSREAGFKKPADYKRLEAVATAFEKTRIEGTTIMERLKNNSRLFNQKDRHDGFELRSYMKRQWEILYLLQNKSQEASNFGLQTYTWSVRNQIWLLQSLFSAKRRELNLLFQSPGKDKASIATEIKTQIEPLYEQLFHMMNLEFASIKPEIAMRLTDDIEVRQRQVVINTVESFIIDREKILKGLIK